jgi:hypothetical protein
VTRAILSCLYQSGGRASFISVRLLFTPRILNVFGDVYLRYGTFMPPSSDYYREEGDKKQL